MTETTPMEYTQEHTARATERFTEGIAVLSDEKDDLELLRDKLAKRKKPIYAGLAFLCVVVIGVSVAVSTGKTTQASTSSGYVETPAPETPAPSIVDDATAGVHAPELSSAVGSDSGSASGSIAGEASLEEGLLAMNSTTPEPTTETPTPAPTTGPILPYKALDFNWKDPSNWEYAGGGGVSGAMVNNDGIKLTPANSAQPIRTKQGWGGEKIVLIEWERSPTSDTNIWMLNTKLQNQFAQGNGWPYWGEIDIFEMFTQDKIDTKDPSHDFNAKVTRGDVSSYGSFTLHNGPKWPAQPCFCPASHSEYAWFQNTAPMTSGCTAQFPSSTTSMATIWGSDGNGQYLQLIQNPTVTKGGKVDEVQTYDITPGSGAVTMKIYNNKELFWGTPVSAPCVSNSGHNAATGFPFFEDFRIILEEQKKNDGSAWFKVNNIQIFKK